jgi:uncharacterized protein (TIGR03435 family)
MRRTTTFVLLALSLALRLSGQATPSRPSFEVASVKVNKRDMVTDRAPRRSGDRVWMHNASLGMFVDYAYGVENSIYQIADKNGLLDSDTDFDIDAIAPGAVSDADLRLMFQTLLEDRFKLKVHWETRELAGCDLVAVKGGSKIKPTSPDNKITVDGHVFPMGTSQLYIAADRVGHLIGKGSSIEQLIRQLTGRVRTPIRDRTGLTGTFDYNVAFVLNPTQADANSAPMITTAIQEELGLKLEKSKIPVEVLVIDHVENPTAN